MNQYHSQTWIKRQSKRRASSGWIKQAVFKNCAISSTGHVQEWVGKLPAEKGCLLFKVIFKAGSTALPNFSIF